MAFRTKLDYSDNRQIKQRERTNTTLSGATVFGVPFSGLTSGPDLTTTTQTSQYFGVTSTYSGNSATTIFTWGIPNVSIVDSYISALTPSNSGVSQNISAVFTSSSSTIIDGNTVNLTYSGVSAQNLYAITMSEPTPGSYTGTVSTDFFIFSAGTLDFTGRTIWNDVSGILKTERLIITDNPQIGNVWTCIDSEGMGAWVPNSSADTNTYTTGATLINDIAYFDTNASLSAYTLNLTSLASTNWDSGSTGNYSVKQITNTTTDATADYAVVTGRDNIASGIGSFIGGGYLSSATTVNAAVIGGDECIASGFDAFVGGGDNNKATSDDSAVIAGVFNTVSGQSSVIIGGSGGFLSGQRSAIIGGSNIIGSTNDMVYMPSATISDNLGIGTEPQYKFHIVSGNTQLYFDPTSVGGRFLLSGTTGLPRIDVQIPSYLTNPTAGGGIGIRSWDDVAWASYGNTGDTYVYSSIYSNGLNLISAPGTSTDDYIRFYVGQDATGIPDIHIQGSGSTRGYVALSGSNPTQCLDVGGNGRFRNIGSSASAGALHYTSDGTLTTNTSDFRLKANIKPVKNALDKILNLRGVYYNWIEDITGSTRLGFIAQEVNSVVPELVFTNERTQEKYMGVHYDNVTALLVEGFKELISGNTTINNNYLETQTIAAEDNNIELNYNGNKESAIGGGISVINGLDNGISAEFKLNPEGSWITNNSIAPLSLIIPERTPSSSSDNYGKVGDITRDENYLYIKGNNGWKRLPFESF